MSDILSHLEGGILTLTFHRPARKHAMTAGMYAVLADALEAAVEDDGVRVVVLQGDETVFTAGNDLGDFLQSPPSDPDAPVFRLLRALATFPKPLLAAVCGPAVGIGTTLLFHCDLVYAGDNAAFAMPFVNLGVCAEGASSLLAPQLMGYHRAAEALLLGEPIYAEAALEVGLVNRVLPPTEVRGEVQRLAHKLAAKPMVPLRITKQLMKQRQQPEVLAAIADEAQAFARLLSEPAAREAMAAFLDKRKPDFSGM